jgi:hypothetical protein
MAKKEIRQLLHKTPRVDLQQAGLLQLRVLKKELQAFYKQLLVNEEPATLEKAVNDMVFNVSDAI